MRGDPGRAAGATGRQSKSGWDTDGTDLRIVERTATDDGEFSGLSGPPEGLPVAVALPAPRNSITGAATAPVTAASLARIVVVFMASSLLVFAAPGGPLSRVSATTSYWTHTFSGVDFLRA